MSVKFENYSVKVKAALAGAAEAFLEEAAAEIENKADDYSPVDTGQLAGSWAHHVDGTTATVGSPLEYAIYQEFGTGEFALEGNGRKGGWVYKDRHGETHFTRGSKPHRMLHRAFTESKGSISSLAKQHFGELD